MSEGTRTQPPGDSGRPHRKHTLWMKIDADDVDGLRAELRHIETELFRGNMTQSSVSGGYSVSHIVVHSVDGNMDHDTWATELDAWLAELDRKEVAA